MKTTSGSQSLFEKAKQFIPGGVNSPVRAFKAVGGSPLFMKRAKGAYLYDEDDNVYLDLINSWGPMILGHAHPLVEEAVKEALAKALGTGWLEGTNINEAEVLNDEKGKPYLDFVGETAAIISAMHINAFHVSISHTKSMATAIVIVEKND